MTLYEFAVLVHFLGLAMGFSVTFANIVMAILAAKSDAADRPALRRFPPMMSKVGYIGIALLWASGIYLIRPMWTGFGELQWELQAKLISVVLLTLSVLYIATQEPRAKGGDAGAAKRIEGVAKATALFALSALVFAVMAFR
jgi:hypothetical protein